jgi:uncharacterized membrane protein YfcA
LLWPFVLGSIPLSFVGGAVHLPGSLYKQVLGVILLYAAVRLLLPFRTKTPLDGDGRVPTVPAVGAGAVIGLLSGLTGTGGGIFLSPFLLVMGWAETRPTAGDSAAFILVNSIAGLAGNIATVRSLPESTPILAVAAVLGGLIGTELGSRQLATKAMLRLLAGVLVIAGFKLILT